MEISVLGIRDRGRRIMSDLRCLLVLENDSGLLYSRLPITPGRYLCIPFHLTLFTHSFLLVLL